MITRLIVIVMFFKVFPVPVSFTAVVAGAVAFLLWVVVEEWENGKKK